MSTSFGKYDLRREIGRDACSVLYEAVDPSLQRDVTLKIFSLPEEIDPAARRRAVEQFYREGRALAGLSHPNLGAVVDMGEAGGGCYLALELLRGSTLRERLAANGPLNSGEVVRIGIAVCQALEHMHRRGVVHRAVTPDQIMLLPDGRVKLTGFGLSVQASGAPAQAGSPVQTTNDEGQSPVAQAATEDTGSPANLQFAFSNPHFPSSPPPLKDAYASPEQRLGAPADGRSDLFSLGVTLYEAATGSRPGADVPPAPPLPDFLQRILARAMEREPADRYPEAAAMAADLQRQRLSPRIEASAAASQPAAAGPATGPAATSRTTTATATPTSRPEWATRAQDPLLFPRPVAGTPPPPPPAFRPHAAPGIYMENTSGMGANAEVPIEITHQWNWGAFVLPFFWGIANRVWTGLTCLSLIFCPPVGIPATLVAMVVMGINGNEWAWRNRRWESPEQFRRTQRIWSTWGIGVLVAMAFLLVAAMMMAFE